MAVISSIVEGLERRGRHNVNRVAVSCVVLNNEGLSLFGVGEWVGGGGGAGRVVWGYGYHVVVHRRPATA